MSEGPPTGADAAEAHERASRPWYKKKRFLIPAVLVAVAVIVVGTALATGTSLDAWDSAGDAQPTEQETSTQGEGGSDSGEGDGSSEEASDAPPQTFGSRTLPQQDGDWRLESVRVKNDGSGTFTGTAEVTYTGQKDEGGNSFFTVTLFKSREQIAVLNGGAIAVHPGQTATVQLESQDQYTKGPYSYDFRNDL